MLRQALRQFGQPLLKRLAFRNHPIREQSPTAIRFPKRRGVSATEADRWRQRAKNLHVESPVILIHDHEPLPDDLQACRAAGISGKVLVPILDTEPESNYRRYAQEFEGWAARAEKKLIKAKEEIDSTDGLAFLASSAADFETAHREGRVAVMLASEGAKLLEGDPQQLQFWHRLGLRQLQLNWAFSNQMAGSCADHHGLTPAGRQLIKLANQLGILIDLTHSSSQTFQDVLELSKKPVLISHGVCRGAFQYGRHRGGGHGVQDETLRSLARNGGLLGIHFFAPFYHRSETGRSDITLEDAIEHTLYAINVMGEDHVALGCDYFPDHGGWFDLQQAQNSVPIRFVVEKQCLYQFTAGLLARSCPETTARKILGGNFLRVCRNVIG